MKSALNSFQLSGEQTAVTGFTHEAQGRKPGGSTQRTRLGVETGDPLTLTGDKESFTRDRFPLTDLRSSALGEKSQHV